MGIHDALHVIGLARPLGSNRCLLFLFVGPYYQGPNHPVSLADLRQMLFLEETLTQPLVLRLVEQAFELHGSPGIVDHDPRPSFFSTPFLEPYLLLGAEIDGKAKRPSLHLEGRAIPATVEGFPNLALLGVGPSEREELALEDVDAGGVGQFANMDVDSAVPLRDAYLARVRKLALDEVTSKILEFLASTARP